MVKKPKYFKFIMKMMMSLFLIEENLILGSIILFPVDYVSLRKKLHIDTNC